MDSHIEPVDTWGREPCGSLEFPTPAYAFGRGGGCAPRPSGTGRGIFEVQTSLIKLLLSYGPRFVFGEKEVKSYDSQTSSPAAAPSSTLKMAIPFQGDCLCRADGNLACAFLVHQPRMSGDLENSLRGHDV